MYRNVTPYKCSCGSFLLPSSEKHNGWGGQHWKKLAERLISRSPSLCLPLASFLWPTGPPELLQKELPGLWSPWAKRANKPATTVVRWATFHQLAFLLPWQQPATQPQGPLTCSLKYRKLFDMMMACLSYGPLPCSLHPAHPWLCRHTCLQTPTSPSPPSL